jgi:hypothetical protein
MVIDLCNGVPMAKSPQAFSICLDNLLIDDREFLLQPGQKGRTEIEIDEGVIVTIFRIRPLPSIIRA